jgi:hypothetical protein
MIIPVLVEVLCEQGFCDCWSLSSVRFESRSSLSRVKKEAFSRTGLVEIVVLATDEFQAEKCLHECIVLELKRMNLMEWNSRDHHRCARNRMPDCYCWRKNTCWAWWLEIEGRKIIEWYEIHNFIHDSVKLNLVHRFRAGNFGYSNAFLWFFTKTEDYTFWTPWKKICGSIEERFENHNSVFCSINWFTIPFHLRFNVVTNMFEWGFGIRLAVHDWIKEFTFTNKNKNEKQLRAKIDWSGFQTSSTKMAEAMGVNCVWPSSRSVQIFSSFSWITIARRSQRTTAKAIICRPVTSSQIYLFRFCHEVDSEIPNIHGERNSIS